MQHTSLFSTELSLLKLLGILVADNLDLKIMFMQIKSAHLILKKITTKKWTYCCFFPVLWCFLFVKVWQIPSCCNFKKSSVSTPKMKYLCINLTISELYLYEERYRIRIKEIKELFWKFLYCYFSFLN